jgi:hypothetical protein
VWCGGLLLFGEGGGRYLLWMWCLKVEVSEGSEASKLRCSVLGDEQCAWAMAGGMSSQWLPCVGR